MINGSDKQNDSNKQEYPEESKEVKARFVGGSYEIVSDKSASESDMFSSEYDRRQSDLHGDEFKAMRNE
jgi:hypothetical protein